jgi:hypothetical protein
VDVGADPVPAFPLPAPAVVEIGAVPVPIFPLPAPTVLGCWLYTRFQPAWVLVMDARCPGRGLADAMPPLASMKTAAPPATAMPSARLLVCPAVPVAPLETRI